MSASPLALSFVDGAVIVLSAGVLLGFAFLFYRALANAYAEDRSWRNHKRQVAAQQAHRSAVLDSVRYFDLAEHMDRSGLASGANLLRDEALRLAASVHTFIRIRRGCTDE